MTGFLIAMGTIGAVVIAGERAWVWWVHRLEERASRDTSWAYTATGYKASVRTTEMSDEDEVCKFCGEQIVPCDHAPAPGSDHFDGLTGYRYCQRRDRPGRDHESKSGALPSEVRDHTAALLSNRSTER